MEKTKALKPDRPQYSIFNAGYVGGLGMTAEAATTSVTIPYPSGELSTFDPSQWSGQILFDQGTRLEGLYGYNAKNQIVPKLANSYTTSDGGRAWTFNLVHTAWWSNGAPMTAQDFYYARMRLLSPSDTTGATWASVVNYVKNAAAYHAGAMAASAVGINVVILRAGHSFRSLENSIGLENHYATTGWDAHRPGIKPSNLTRAQYNAYKLQITLTGPYNPLGDFALTGSMPLYPPDVEKYPTTWWQPAHFVGEGPYVVKTFMINGEVTLARNPKYVGPPGSVGNVQTIKLIPAPTIPVADFEYGSPRREHGPSPGTFLTSMRASHEASASSDEKRIPPHRVLRAGDKKGMDGSDASVGEAVLARSDQLTGVLVVYTAPGSVMIWF